MNDSEKIVQPIAPQQQGGAVPPKPVAAAAPVSPKPAAPQRPGVPPPQQQQAPKLVHIRPVAAPASMKIRHWGMLGSFMILVLLPLVVTVFYLFVIAKDQYASTVGFTVRKEDASEAGASLLGGLAQFAGTSGTSESDILYEFIQSQEIVEAIDKEIDLRALYAKAWPGDPAFALWPGSTIEDLLFYWKRMVRVSYDQSTRLIGLRILAFAPDDAQRIASAIVSESQRKINDLNAAARADVTRYATEDLDVAIERLKKSREAMTQFRTENQVVDPTADIQSRLGVLANLQQQLAQSLVDHDLLAQQTVDESDPRLQPAKRKIDVIRERIAAERQAFATGSNEVGDISEDYPQLIAEYENLLVDRQYAEEAYRLSLAARDIARAEASRQSFYLASFVNPTLPETSEYPQRFVLSGLVGLFLVLTWSIVILIFYSIRDRR